MTIEPTLASGSAQRDWLADLQPHGAAPVGVATRGDPEGAYDGVVSAFRRCEASPEGRRAMRGFDLGPELLWVLGEVRGHEGSVVLVDRSSRAAVHASPGLPCVTALDDRRLGGAFEQIGGRDFVALPLHDDAAVLARRLPLASGDRRMFFSRARLLPEHLETELVRLNRFSDLDALLARGHVVIGDLVERPALPGGRAWEVSDVRAPDGRFVDAGELALLCDQHGLRPAPTVARARATELDDFVARVQAALDDDRRGARGVVLKTTDGQTRVAIGSRRAS